MSKTLAKFQMFQPLSSGHHQWVITKCADKDHLYTNRYQKYAIMITNNRREKQVSSAGLLEFRAGSTDQSIAHFRYWFVYKWSLSAHFVTTH